MLERCKTCDKTIWFPWQKISLKDLPSDVNPEDHELMREVSKTCKFYNHYHNNKKCFILYDVFKKIKNACGGEIDIDGVQVDYECGHNDEDECDCSNAIDIDVDVIDKPEKSVRFEIKVDKDGKIISNIMKDRKDKN